MNQVAIDEALFEALGLTFSREGDLATFCTEDKPDPVVVSIVDEKLVFVPGRSAGHQRVLSIINGA